MGLMRIMSVVNETYYNKTKTVIYLLCKCGKLVPEKYLKIYGMCGECFDKSRKN